MDAALLASAVAAVSDVAAAAEVRAAVDDCVRHVEEAHNKDQVQRLTRALRLARAHMEAMQADRERERVRRFNEAVEAAELRRDFEREMHAVLSEATAKRHLEARLRERDQQVAALVKQLSSRGMSPAEAAGGSNAMGAGGGGGVGALTSDGGGSGGGVGNGDGGSGGGGGVPGRRSSNASTGAPAVPSGPLDGEQLFGTVKKELLHRIILYCQWNDVLNLAQCSRGFYRRVDDMFGGTASSGVGSLGSLPRPAVPTPSLIARGVSGASAGSTSSVDRPPPGPKSSPARTKSKLFGRLSRSQPKADAGGGSSQASTAERKAHARTLARLEAVEAELAKVVPEREDLGAQLAANEKVRDFLMSKVKDAEEATRRADEARDQAIAQSTSDKQVISFLDAHTRELEEKVGVLTRERDEARTELERIVPEHTTRVKMLEDELDTLRSKHRELEAQSKREKKQLIKAVKQLKSQLEHAGGAAGAGSVDGGDGK